MVPTWDTSLDRSLQEPPLQRDTFVGMWQRDLGCPTGADAAGPPTTLARNPRPLQVLAGAWRCSCCSELSGPSPASVSLCA